MLTKSKKNDWTRSKLYDWDKWLSQSRFTLVDGRHFGCGRGSIVLQTRMAAYRRGALVSIKETPAGVVVTVTRKPTKVFPPVKSSAASKGGTNGKK